MATVAGVGAVGVAGCLGDDDDGSSGDGSAGDGSSESGSGDDESGRVDESDVTLTDEYDGVTVSVTFVDPLVVGGADHSLADEAVENLVFQVAMDTHSGDLTALDWGERARVETGDGREARGLEWRWTSEDDHHPAGYYVVENADRHDETLVDGETASVALTLEVEDGSLRFEWSLSEHPVEDEP